MQTEGAGFMDAVQRLAAEAGLEVPKPSPEAAETERRRLGLATVLEAAQAGFQRRLFLPEGRSALAYLRGRGLSDDTIRRFGLGWSGDTRGALLADLGRDGVTQEQLLEAGLLRQDDETGRTFDLFMNRVMFPIRDRGGRVVSFGGRSLGNGQPKYLNGPETALFAKRRTLYGLDLAREAVRSGASLVVVEGYMDVIALVQAGVGAAVAPLGTALTEEQLEALWRLAPSPILCFDGDAAGARAAARSADLALPLLAPDRTLRIARLPAGEDPDTLVRAQGSEAMRGVLSSAAPLADALYDLLREAAGEATPEQRAAFRTRLETAARRIADRNLATEYRRALLDRFFDSRRRRRAAPPQRALARPPCDPGRVVDERCRILTAILLRHPMLLRDVEHAYLDLDLPPRLAALRSALLEWAEVADILDSQGLMSHLTVSGLQAEAEQVLAPTPVPLPACVSSEAMPAEALAGWWHIFGFLSVQRLGEEIALAEAACRADLTPQSQNRLIALKAALNKVVSDEPDGVGSPDEEEDVGAS
jgi:DNA primase